MSDPSRPAALGDHGRGLLERALAWCDGLFDSDRDLPMGSMPADGLHPERVHFVQQAGWYAFGLLGRNGPGDDARAGRVLDALLALQYGDPLHDAGRPWHGTFARFAESPQPRAGAVAFLHFDPNWRQFVGTTLLQLLQAFAPRLGARRIAAIDEALALCVRGEPVDRVPASYTNISLMRAFLESEAGLRLGEPSWVERGEAVARAVVERFDRHGVFEEYNSPTYYGVDLIALGQWRRCASSSLLREQGERIESAMWRDLARWYHPGLRNFCGPYSRTYGMDMCRYLGMVGLWITFGLDLPPERAPLPAIEPGQPIEHGHDLFTAPTIAWLGAAIPGGARELLCEPGGRRELVQTISTSEGRVATGLIETAFMIGGETCAPDRSAFAQYVPATLHWRLPDGGVGWLVVRAPGPSRARVADGALQVEWRAAPRDGARPPWVSLQAGDVAFDAFDGDAWRLPGLTLGVGGNVSIDAVERRGDRIRLQLGHAANGADARLVLTPRSG